MEGQLIVIFWFCIYYYHGIIITDNIICHIHINTYIEN